MKTDLIEILYSEKVILDGKRTEQDVAFSVERAARINSLMERKIFNEEFIRELQQRTPYSEIESCYTFIVKTIMSRAALRKILCKRFSTKSRLVQWKQCRKWAEALPHLWSRWGAVCAPEA